MTEYQKKSLNTVEVPVAEKKTQTNQFASFLKLCGSFDKTKPAPSEKSTFEQALSNYKSEIKHSTSTFDQFWKEHKHFSLSVFVKKYSIIPATSVAVESAFSEANYVQRKERSRLSPKNLMASMCLKSIYRSNIFDSL